MGGHVFAHLLAHEHGIRADVDYTALGMDAGNQLFDLRINQGFSTANRYHWGIALGRRSEAGLERNHVLEAGRVLTDASASSAGEVARVQWLKLEHHGEAGGPLQLVLHDVPGNLNC